MSTSEKKLIGLGHEAGEAGLTRGKPRIFNRQLLVGDARAVCGQLEKVPTQCVIALRVSDDSVLQIADDVEFTQTIKQALLDGIMEAVLPDKPTPPSRLLREAKMLLRAKRAVLDSGDWMTAAEVATAAGLQTSNPSTQTGKWKRANKIFAIYHKGCDYYPAYGLDKQHNFRPLPMMHTLIEILSTKIDGWGMAYWFESVNGHLSGKAPKAMLTIDPDRVIDAAKVEVDGVLHG